MGDKQSCKKLSTGQDDSAFEAKDLENEVDYDQLNSKISRIEKVRLDSVGWGSMFAYFYRINCWII